jgi:hypothetical protein
MALPLAGIVGVLQRNVNGLSYVSSFVRGTIIVRKSPYSLTRLPGNKRRKLVLTPVLSSSLRTVASMAKITVRNQTQ